MCPAEGIPEGLANSGYWQREFFGSTEERAVVIAAKQAAFKPQHAQQQCQHAQQQCQHAQQQPQHAQQRPAQRAQQQPAQRAQQQPEVEPQQESQTVSRATHESSSSGSWFMICLHPFNTQQSNASFGVTFQMAQSTSRQASARCQPLSFTPGSLSILHKHFWDLGY